MAALLNDRHSVTSRRRQVDSSVKLCRPHRLDSQQPGLLFLAPGLVESRADVATFVDDVVVIL